MGKLRFYKATAPGGIAHHDGKTRYVVGERLTVDNPSPYSAGACGRGLHVVTQLAHISNYVQGENLSQSEFYEVEVDPGDVIAADSTKTRVRSLRVIRRITERDVGILRGQLAALVGYGYGYGDGSGYGSDEGDGYGSDEGDGYGYGYGDGDGHGSDEGDGYGSDEGDGSGEGE